MKSPIDYGLYASGYSNREVKYKKVPVSKPKTKNNRRAGKALQKIRVAKGVHEQLALATALGWKENKVRDREIAVASITLVDVCRFSIAFQMDKVEIAKLMVAPIAISLDKVTVDNTTNGMWINHDKFGEKKTWAMAIMEKGFPNSWTAYSDYDDALLFLTDSIDDIRRDCTDQIREGKMKPFELVSCAHLGPEWELKEMKKQGDALKGIRLRKSMASQWVAASKVGTNQSWIQCRESAKVSIKLEDVIALGEAWDVNPFKMCEILLTDTPPDYEELKLLRRKFC